MGFGVWRVIDDYGFFKSIGFWIRMAYNENSQFVVELEEAQSVWVRVWNFDFYRIFEVLKIVNEDSLEFRLVENIFENW